MVPGHGPLTTHRRGAGKQSVSAENWHISCSIRLQRLQAAATLPSPKLRSGVIRLNTRYPSRWKIVEVARMHQHRLLPARAQSPGLHPTASPAPAAPHTIRLRTSQPAGRIFVPLVGRSKSARFARTRLQQLRLDTLPLIEQNRSGKLHRRVHREIGIGDNFQSLPSPASTVAAGPLTAIHASFICGSPEIFDNPLSVNVSASSFPTKLAAARAIARIVEKNFVHDQAPGHAPGKMRSASRAPPALTYEPVGLFG